MDLIGDRIRTWVSLAGSENVIFNTNSGVEKTRYLLNDRFSKKQWSHTSCWLTDLDSGNAIVLRYWRWSIYGASPFLEEAENGMQLLARWTIDGVRRSSAIPENDLRMKLNFRRYRRLSLYARTGMQTSAALSDRSGEMCHTMIPDMTRCRVLSLGRLLRSVPLFLVIFQNSSILYEWFSVPGNQVPEFCSFFLCRNRRFVNRGRPKPLFPRFDCMKCHVVLSLPRHMRETSSAC